MGGKLQSSLDLFGGVDRVKVTKYGELKILSEYPLIVVAKARQEPSKSHWNQMEYYYVARV